MGRRYSPWWRCGGNDRGFPLDNCNRKTLHVAFAVELANPEGIGRIGRVDNFVVFDAGNGLKFAERFSRQEFVRFPCNFFAVDSRKLLHYNGFGRVVLECDPSGVGIPGDGAHRRKNRKAGQQSRIANHGG